MSVIADYSRPVKFEHGSALDYPDFSIKFLGQSMHYDWYEGKERQRMEFEAKGKYGTFKAEWIDGMVSAFNVDGNDFFIELRVSRILQGPIPAGHLVIWRKDDFESLSQK